MTSEPKFLARHTPSLMDPAELALLQVGREQELEELLSVLGRSVRGEGRAHPILIGPRGIGKTFLVSRAVADLRAEEAGFLLAWLPEDVWGITGYADLLNATLEALDRSESGLDDEEREDLRTSLADLHAAPPAEPEALEAALERNLEVVRSSRPLLLVIENLDDLLGDMSKRDQRRLRGYLQDVEGVAILASALRPFEAIATREGVFFGFFTARQLRPLEFAEFLELVRNELRRTGEGALAEVLDQPVKRARVRALHYVARGNPRVGLLFARFLTEERIEELGGPVLEALDDLTPYYQSQMRVLSPQQRKLVDELARYGKPMKVGDLARRCLVAPQAASAQLGHLRAAGIVESRRDGRESFYEIHDPLMRLALRSKAERGGAVGVLVEFLSKWFTAEELVREFGRNTVERRVDWGKPSELAAKLEKSTRWTGPVKTLLAELRESVSDFAWWRTEDLLLELQELTGAEIFRDFRILNDFSLGNGTHWRSIYADRELAGPLEGPRFELEGSPENVERSFLDWIDFYATHEPETERSQIDQSQEETAEIELLQLVVLVLAGSLALNAGDEERADVFRERVIKELDRYIEENEEELKSEGVLDLTRQFVREGMQTFFDPSLPQAIAEFAVGNPEASLACVQILAEGGHISLAEQILDSVIDIQRGAKRHAALRKKLSLLFVNEAATRPLDEIPALLKQGWPIDKGEELDFSFAIYLPVAELVEWASQREELLTLQRRLQEVAERYREGGLPKWIVGGAYFLIVQGLAEERISPSAASVFAETVDMEPATHPAEQWIRLALDAAIKLAEGASMRDLADIPSDIRAFLEDQFSSAAGA